MLTKGFRESHTGEEIEIDADPGMSFVASLPSWHRHLLLFCVMCLVKRGEGEGERERREKGENARRKSTKRAVTHNFCSQTSFCCY